MAKLHEIVIDSLNPPALARFWATVLDGYAVRPYDTKEIQRLAELGHTPDTDPNVAVDNIAGDGPVLFFQKTGTSNEQRNRIHLDVHTNHLEDEVVRLKALGASVRDKHVGYVVMLDPEGNQFCVVGSVSN